MVSSSFQWELGAGCWPHLGEAGGLPDRSLGLHGCQTHVCPWQGLLAQRPVQGRLWASGGADGAIEGRMPPPLDRSRILRHRGGENGCLSEIWIYRGSRGGQAGRNRQTHNLPIVCPSCISALSCQKFSPTTRAWAGDSPPPS